MNKRTPCRDSITDLFKKFGGQGNTLVIPRPYIELCKGDHLAALLLSQILYWSDRTDDENGWFSKSYEEWYDELAMTEYQVRRAIKGDKRAKKPTPGLAALGVEVLLKPSRFHAGAPTLHYRVDLDKLQSAVLDIVQNGVLDNVQNRKSTMFRTDTEQSQGSYTETTTEITAKPISKRAPKKPTKGEIFWLEWKEHDQIGRAILDAFGYDTAFKEPTRYPMKFLEPYLEAAKQLHDADTAEISAAYRYLMTKAKRERWTVSPSPLSLAKYFPEYQRSQHNKIIPLPVEEFPMPTADPTELRARLSGESLPKVSGDYE